MRTGDFSELLVANPYTKTPVIIKDPKTGQPFPGNIIPAPGTTGGTGSVASANGLGLLNQYPVPNLTTPLANGNNWFFSASHPQNQRKDTLSVDYNMTEKQRLRFRRMYYTFHEYQPLDGGTNEAPKFFDRPNYTYSLNHTWSFKSTASHHQVVVRYAIIVAFNGLSTVLIVGGLHQAGLYYLWAKVIAIASDINPAATGRCRSRTG